MNQIFTFAFLLLYCSNLFGQKSNREDSVFQLLLKQIPEAQKKDAIERYNLSSPADRSLLFFELSMPKSSRQKLITNIDSNFEKINYLTTEYSKIVPKNSVISIEFKPENIFAKMKESIDLKIEQVKKLEGVNVEYKNIAQKWRLDYNSPELAEMLKSVNWSVETLKSVKKLLADANCISIENGPITTIGFARSGMGKYFFKIFQHDLSGEEIKKYNDGCKYIFYKKNIVLEYGGGAVGPQCFPD